MSTARYASLYERLVANTHEPDSEQGCWLWAGNTDAKGYGRLAMRKPGRQNPVGVRAHRVMLEQVLGRQLEEHEEGDHLCFVTSCVNPDHLEVVTGPVNLKRRDERRAARGKLLRPSL